MVCCEPKMVGLLSRGDTRPRGFCTRGWFPCRGCPGAQTRRGAGRPARGLRRDHRAQSVPVTQGHAVRGCFRGRMGVGGVWVTEPHTDGLRVTSFMGQAKCNAKLFLFLFF